MISRTYADLFRVYFGIPYSELKSTTLPRTNYVSGDLRGALDEGDILLSFRNMVLFCLGFGRFPSFHYAHCHLSRLTLGDFRPNATWTWTFLPPFCLSGRLPGHHAQRLCDGRTSSAPNWSSVLEPRSLVRAGMSTQSSVATKIFAGCHIRSLMPCQF